MNKKNSVTYRETDGLTDRVIHRGSPLIKQFSYVKIFDIFLYTYNYQNALTKIIHN